MKIQNTHRKGVALAILLGLLSSHQALFAQTAPNADIPRLANGRPDLQGTWDFRTITPFQRPFGARRERIVDRLKKSRRPFRLEELERRDRDNFTDTTTTGDYNEFWYDRGQEILDDGRTSLITDPHRRAVFLR